MARRIPLLLLAVAAGVLFAHLAGLDHAGSSNAAGVGIQPAQLESADLPLQAGRDLIDSRPALKRGGHAMSAVESSRRKLRVPQRPPVQPLILTGGLMADGPAPSCAGLRLLCGPPLERFRLRPVLATGPPLRDIA